MYISAKLKDNGRRVHVLCDTGCQGNLVGKHLIADVKLEPATTRMMAANNSPINVLGVAEIVLIIGGVEFPIKVSVSDQIDEFIVGTQWLTNNDCVWNFPRKTISLRGHVVKLLSRPSVGMVRRVLAVDDVTIVERQCSVRG